LTRPPRRANKPSVAIVAHTSRAAWANELKTLTGAAHVSMDDGTLGCYRNHLTAWTWHQQHSYHGWATVIEDDAIPVPHFPDQLTLALDNAPPAISIVSLYLGRARPPQYQIPVAAAISDTVDRDHAWIITTKLLHAVGVAIRTELLPSLIAHLSRAQPTGLDIDEAITQWAGLRHMIAYTAPSLLDHRDGATIAAHRDGIPRATGRKAWRFGERDNWKTPVSVMTLP
jgi:hypothetical protein